MKFAYMTGMTTHNEKYVAKGGRKVELGTNELAKKKQKLLDLVMDEIAHIGLNQPLQLPHVENFVAESLVLVQCGKHYEAWSKLWSVYKCLLPDPEINGLWHFSREEYRERFANELVLLDLGIFAYRLEGSFLQLHDVAPYLWEKRKDLYPHLSGALKAAYWFRCSIEAGRKPEEALSRALEVRNELRDAFGDRYIYHEKKISELLSPEALAKLREVLLGIYNESRLDDEAGNRKPLTI